MTCRPLTLLLAALPLLTGCATYEYDLLKPEQFATHIPRKSEVKVAIDPLDYRFVSYENHLIVRIINPTDEPIQLLGGQSSAVDPSGESHPLRTQTIAPETFIKLILPPPRPQFRDDGPYIGFGVGVVGRAGHRGFYDPFYGSAFYDEPRYYTVYDESDNFYWDWNDESTARLLLTFQRGGEMFHHEFTFKRRKV
jgi:hypothetical protein